MRCHILLLLVCSTIVQSAAIEKRALKCQENIAIPVSATAENLVVPSSLNLSALTINNPNYLKQLASTLSRQNVSGTYTIRGRYCEPTTSNPKRHNTLQLLVHGVTFTKDYWSGLGINGTQYSWIDYASQQGYPTLSIDRLCNGASSHPNGALVCQVPMNAATIHAVIQAARNGQIGGRAFNKIIYVGHSEGSLIGDQLAQLYPKDVDTYVQTGFSPLIVISSVGTIIAGAFIPALLADPVKFATYSDLTYLAASNKAGTEGLFFAGKYDHSVADYEWETRGTVPSGEFLTVFNGQLPAPGFTGSLLALNGERDEIFCARLPTDPVVGYRGDCGEGDRSYTAMVKDLYPNAVNFEYVNVENTGHNLNLHETSQQTFKIAHEYLSGLGY